MTQAYLVTERQIDATLLKKLLPAQIVEQTTFVDGTGRYSAQSLSLSILAVKQQPVALVINAHTEDAIAMQEQRDFLRELLGQVSAGVPFEIFFAVPEMESVFFQDQALFEQLTHQKFTLAEWNAAKRHPGEALTQICGGNTQRVAALITNLSDEAVTILQQHPLICGLHTFLAAVSAATVAVLPK